MAVKLLQIDGERLDPPGADARWVQCDSCDDKWCSVHWLHAFECPCPGLEDQLYPEDGSSGYNPYDEIGPTDRPEDQPIFEDTW